jgi:transcriptional regulator with XRE-family HTH domain
MTAQEATEELYRIYGGTNAAADAVGISRVTISRIRAGYLLPSPSLLAHLERELARIQRYAT